MKINYTLIAAAAVAAALVYKFKDMRSIGASVGGAAFDVVDGVVEGSVVSIGQTVGIPPTDANRCASAMAQGKTWQASFDCPAKDFISYLFK